MARCRCSSSLPSQRARDATRRAGEGLGRERPTRTGKKRAEAPSPWGRRASSLFLPSPGQKKKSPAPPRTYSLVGHDVSSLNTHRHACAFSTFKFFREKVISSVFFSLRFLTHIKHCLTLHLVSLLFFFRIRDLNHTSHPCTPPATTKNPSPCSSFVPKKKKNLPVLSSTTSVSFPFFSLHLHFRRASPLDQTNKRLFCGTQQRQPCWRFL